MKRWFKRRRRAAVVLSIQELECIGLLGEDSAVLKAVPYLLQALRDAEVELLASHAPCDSDELHRIRGKIQAFEQMERKWQDLVERCVRRVRGGDR